MNFGGFLIKLWQKSMEINGNQWKTWFFVIFVHFWWFPMRPTLLTWPVPTRMVHHPSSQIDPRSETSKAQACWRSLGHNKTSCSATIMKLRKYLDFHDFVFFLSSNSEINQVLLLIWANARRDNYQSEHANTPPKRASRLVCMRETHVRPPQGTHGARGGRSKSVIRA